MTKQKTICCSLLACVDGSRKTGVTNLLGRERHHAGLGTAKLHRPGNKGVESALSSKIQSARHFFSSICPASPPQGSIWPTKASREMSREKKHSTARLDLAALARSATGAGAMKPEATCAKGRGASARRTGTCTGIGAKVNPVTLCALQEMLRPIPTWSRS